MDKLKVSSNNRYLAVDDGNDTPFQWAADTHWSLLARITLNEAKSYFDTRKAQGFNVIHCWIFSNWFMDNRDGDSPFNGNLGNPDQTSLNNAYWNHVDDILNAAEQRDLYINLELGYILRKSPLSTTQFGSQAQRRNKSFDVGYAVANRLRSHPNIMFGAGGDTNPDRCDKIGDDNCGSNYVAQVNYLAAGIAAGWNNASRSPSTSQDFTTLVQSHHIGNTTGTWTGNTSDFWHTQDWLKYNSTQSGRPSRFDNTYWQEAQTNYALSPTKPHIDAESLYEDYIPLDESAYRARGWHTRQRLYTTFFAGALGVQYGNNNVWQSYDPARYAPRSDARTKWSSVLTSEGAKSVQYFQRLMKSRPAFTHSPDQDVFTDSPGTDYQHIRALRDTSGRYAMVYSSNGRSFTVDLTKIAGSLKAYWYDPRTGTEQTIGTYSNSGTQLFTPPGGTSSRNDSTGKDYVLVLDEVAQNYPPPGTTGTISAPPGFIMAHRGGGILTAGEVPENTLQAFRHAWSVGANPEGDVRLTSNNRLVFLHDDTVNRTTNGSGAISSKTLQQAQQLDAGSYFHPDYAGAKIPEINEVMQAFAAEAPDGLVFSVDTKVENSTVYSELADAIGANNLWDRVFIEVSSTSVGNAVRAVDSRFRLAYWAGSQGDFSSALAYAHFERIHTRDTLANNIGAIHAAGKKAIIQSDTRQEFCAAMNLWDEPPDGLNSNFPAYMSYWMEAWGYMN